MTKKTSSDALKITISKKYGGAAQDWARVSKKKNEAGAEVREFVNESSGARVIVETLRDNLYNIKRTDVADRGVDIYVSQKHVSQKTAPTEAFQKKSKPPKTQELTENDAADRVMELFMDSYGDDIKKSLLKKAGKSLANHFFFTIIERQAEPGTLEVRIAPLYDGSYDGEVYHLIEHLLSSMGEVSEDQGTIFSFPAYTDPVALAKELMQRGFVLERKHQECSDEHSGTPPMMPHLQALLHETTTKKRDTKMSPADFYFAIWAQEDEPLGVWIEQRSTWERGKCIDGLHDGQLKSLMPKGMGNASSGLWEWNGKGGAITPQELAEKMQAHGFTWNKDFQRAVGSDFTMELPNPKKHYPAGPGA